MKTRPRFRDGDCAVTERVPSLGENPRSRKRLSTVISNITNMQRSL